MTLTSQEPATGTGRDAHGNGNGIPRLVAGLPVPAQRFTLRAWERRRALILFVATVAVLAAGISLLLPRWFTAQSTILPPSESADTFGLMGALVENTTLSRLGLFTSTT